MKSMKRTIQNVLLLLAIACMASCYNDDKLWDAVNDQEERIAALETWQKQVNENISALQTLVNTNDYIKEVTPITLDGEVTGYTITFVHQEPITIYNGEKGETGDTPQINLTKGEDGLWYWTLNGELMKDAEGNPVRANGPDGETGAPAPTPLLKTGAQLTQDAVTGTWTADAIYLSVDNGTTWTKVSGDKGDKGDKGDTGATGPTGSTGSTGAQGSQGAAGKDGDSFFKNVDIETDPNYVIFTLDNETQDEIKIPKATNIADNFDLPSIVNQTDGSILITYIGLKQNITMETVAPQGWSATVTVTKEATDTQEGTGEITLTRSNDGIPYGKLLVFLSDGKETTVMKSIDFILATVWDGTTTAQPAGYTTTPGTIEITSAAELAWMAANIDEDGFKNYTFNLTTDINLNNHEWTPIGVSMKPFKGTFNGQNHTVSNLKCTNTMEAGLFGDLRDATVKDLTVSGSVSYTSAAASEYCYMGGIAGFVIGSTISGCTNQCTVTADIKNGNFKSFVGGIAGYVAGVIGSSTLSDNTNTGTVSVTKTESVAGGIIGYATASGSYSITLTGNTYNGGTPADVCIGRCYITNGGTITVDDDNATHENPYPVPTN